MQAPIPWLRRILDATGVAELYATLAASHPALRVIPRRLAVLGAADEGRRLVEICAANGIEVAALVDDDPVKLGQRVGGVEIQPSSALAALDRQVPVLIASHRVVTATERLRAMGFAHVAPFAALQGLHPEMFPPHVFHRDLLVELITNRDRYEAFAVRLADAESCRVLDAVLALRQTMNAEHLAPIMRWDMYQPGEVMQLGTDEVFVDGGSFDGDTIRDFIRWTGGTYQRVLGFEPDPVTFLRLVSNFSDEPRVEPINAGLLDHEALLPFNATGGKDSILQSVGSSTIRTLALDAVLNGDRASLIKMNIEGAELAALQGSRQTILRWKPKLAISVYHRPSDLWEVAAVIDGIRDDYRFYLRQHDGGVIETVLYALP